VRAPSRRRRRAIVITVAVVVLLALLAWPVGLMIWANGRLTQVAALSGAPDTPGTTYLLAGSDGRGSGTIGQDGTLGARSDTIMLLQVPASGPAALISLPRDTYVDVPGHGPAKLNAAFAWGGAPLLVQTVEKLTGMTVDHYVEVGFGGLENVVDAVGGVSLCSNLTVNDADSGMVWTPGCHQVGGTAALAFARMRKADPAGDIGREQRQQQLIAAITSNVAKPSLAFQPSTQVSLIKAGTGALTVSTGSDIVDMGRLALAFRAAKGPGGITGTPPIANMDYWPGHGLGSTVQLDPAKTPAFFAAIKNGTLPAGAVGGVPKA
jgi:LCP family protein required for cell wall assembly